MMTLLMTLALLKLKSSVSSGSIVLILQSVTTPLSSNLLTPVQLQNLCFKQSYSNKKA